MKTAISIPDDLFERADDLARRLGHSRSQLYRDALTEYLDRRAPAAITRKLDEVVEAVGRDDDGWSRAAAQAALGRSEWS